jgi:hypothetical protein
MSQRQYSIERLIEGRFDILLKDGIIVINSQRGRNNMKNEELLKRITFNPEIFGGKPIIRGMRIAVEHILGMLAAGSTVEEL